MSRKQWLVIILLAVANAIILCLLGFAFAIGVPTRSDTQIAGPPPTETPVPGIPLTWTPRPTATPYEAPVHVLPTSTPRPPTADEMAMLDRVEQEVVALRGLDLLRPVPRWVLTQTQLRRRLADTYQGETLEEETRSLALALAALDLLDPNEDLSNLLQNLLGEQVAGFYDARAEAIYIISDADIAGVADRLVFAHEFGHALQDQHFDLESLGLYATDQSYYYADYIGAVRALVEGDAELIQEQYVGSYLSPEEVIVLRDAYTRADHFRLDEAPRIIREAMLFPYAYGQGFVAALYEEGGWEMVNGAYFIPPVSSEQILHPERYLAGEQPVPVSLPSLTDTLGAGWRLLYDDPVGEFFLRIYLENRLEAAEAAVATEGWGGDRCVVYYNDATAETVMLLRLVWDTPEDTDEFLAAYFTWAEARFAHSADTISDGVACWEGEDVLCLAWEGQGVTIVLGPDRGRVAQVMGVVPSD